MRRSALATLALIVAVSPLSASAAVIALYDGGTGAAGTAAATANAANTSATALTPSGANVTIPIENNGYATVAGSASGGFDFRFVPNNTNLTAIDATSAVNNNAYLFFTITPDAGYQLDLASLTLNISRGGAAVPRGCVIRTSADNFTANLYSADLATVRPTWTPIPLDLSSSAYQHLNTFTVRVYGYTPGTGQSLDLDDVTVNGAVSLVPEPALLAPLGLAAAAFLRRRKV